LKTDLVSVLFLQILSVRPVRLLPHFVLPLISSVYLVPPTRAFAPDRSFLFPNSQRMPTHSLVNSPLHVIMHACALLRSPL
jgi:hypothetical protein